MRIAVIPVSAYGNRLQAIASTMALATRFDASFEVCWIADPGMAAARADHVFDPAWAAAHIVDRSTFEASWGLDALGFPPYLREEGGHLTLAGFDRGEQAFMAQLSALLPADSLAIRAGGHFWLDGDTDSDAGRRNRKAAYAQLPLHPFVRDRAGALADEHGRYIGVHVRLGDRSRQAASPAQLVDAAADLADRSGLTSVFVASDSAEGARTARERLRRRGLDAWDAAPSSRDRQVEDACHPALIDWVLLSKAEAIAFSAASSFGEEATVAGGTWMASLALRPTAARQAMVMSGEYVRAALTYPRRHGWIRRPSAPRDAIGERGAQQPQ